MLATPATALAGSRLPMPEFVSLTYTLPYHLIARLDQLGALTHRSQSELVAESIRLYLKAYAARREHTRISTVEGFSYQEVAVAETGIAADWPEAAAAAPQMAADAVAATAPGAVAPEPVAAPETMFVAATETPPRAPTAPLPEFPSSVTLALDHLDASEQIADPAAEVRRRLRKLAGEPRDSVRLRGALEDIMREVDVRDFSPSSHSMSVANLAQRLAEAKGVTGVALDDIGLAGLLHDIGKANLPDDILQKRRPSPEEMSVIRQYPMFGAELLSLIPALLPAALLVATHQERWNGSGYPDGLQGNDIPLGAQIVALCDVYQVLTTPRRYRPAYDEERARQIIQESAGSLWSPDLARLLLHQVIARERIA